MKCSNTVSVLIQSVSLIEPVGSALRTWRNLNILLFVRGGGVSDTELFYSHSSPSFSLMLGLFDCGLILSVVFPVSLVSWNFSLVVIPCHLKPFNIWGKSLSIEISLSKGRTYNYFFKITVLFRHNIFTIQFINLKCAIQ